MAKKSKASISAGKTVETLTHEEAKRKNIRGRSSMNKAELKRKLGR